MLLRFLVISCASKELHNNYESALMLSYYLSTNVSFCAFEYNKLKVQYESSVEHALLDHNISV